jgi:hypothetical protein
MLLNVQRLAALDMYGTTGSARRRRLIRAEFIIGAAGCTLLGVSALMSGSGWAIVLGIWLVATGMNYLPLAISAQSLSRLGALEAELVGADLQRELRQSWCAPTLDPCPASRSDRRSSAGLEPPAPAPRASRRFTAEPSGSPSDEPDITRERRSPASPLHSACGVTLLTGIAASVSHLGWSSRRVRRALERRDRPQLQVIPCRTRMAGSHSDSLPAPGSVTADATVLVNPREGTGGAPSRSSLLSCLVEVSDPGRQGMMAGSTSGPSGRIFISYRR